MSTLYPAFYRRVIHPAYHALKRDGLNAVMRQALAVDNYDAAAFEALRRRKLATLLRHARTRSPYYREIVPSDAADAVGAGTALHELGLPLLTKSIIRERLDDLVAEGTPPSRMMENSTSGSTGEPMEFYTDIHATLWRRAADARNRHWLGVEIGEREAILWGSQIDNQASNSLRGRLHGLVTRKCAFDAYDLSESRMGEYLAELRRFRPRLLTGYPSVLVRFGHWCESQGLGIPTLKAIITSAEALYEDQRQRITATLGAPVYNRYGCREFGCIAHERPGTEGLLVNGDRLIVEVLDDRGQPCRPGDLGALHVTDLDNLCMPFIRYRIGDLAIAAPPSTAHPYPVLERVEGRSLDVVRSPDGRAVGGTYWTILLRTRPGFRQFQVVQESLDRLRILYRPDPAVAEPDFDFFRDGIRQTCGEAMTVSFEEVGHIPSEPNGKFRIVKSMVPEPHADP